MMLFKRSFGLTMSLFILYVHDHDRLGFGMLTVETAVLNPRVVFVCILFQLGQKRSGNTRVSRTEFVYAMNEHAIANIYSMI